MSRAKGKRAAAPEPATVADLAPADYNPRRMSKAQREQLRRAMLEFGDLSGIVFNRRTGNLIGGHQRRAELPEDAELHVERRAEEPNEQGTVATGWIEIEGERWSYREVDVTPAREKAMNLAANKHRGDWDDALLAELFLDLGDAPEVALTGFDEAEIARLVGDVLAPDQSDRLAADTFAVVISCADEQQQAALLNRFQKEGLSCRALIS